MPELQLVGRRTDGVRDDLVTEADTKDWVGLDEILHGFVGILEGRRIARAVRKENAVGVIGTDDRGRGRRREDLHVKARGHEATEDGGLSAEVVGGDAVTHRTILRLVQVCARDGEGFAVTGGGVVIIGSLAGDFLDEVSADRASPSPRTLEGFFVAQTFGGKAGLHHARRAELLSQ